ncbi:exonuclease SbcCD subunit D C-terminal domain-containing protein [Mailhella massiliensis]|uniref:Nuclease SbcCD subunit D n=1 Tax=Mailhella massiliensis TaxID=1903261 RepID=A0A921AXW4_9BACT|nr:exonuclease SbcCD subunit D C-terminal domain-containing protein [Mailhella massiliensis]HJD97889.1 exonuclease SbcCD subunit D C-terminal domain-containing protein [Mailhella massiliensis]
MMNILHTSDWHLGHQLYGRRRHEEFQAFLAWLQGFVRERQVHALLLAGDVFDSALPGTRAQELYYRFLGDLLSPGSPCRHIVITSGNHDSPAFLDAPDILLSSMGIHITGRAREPEGEVLMLEGPEGEPELIVCAVPFLRERDLYRAKEGEGMQERDRLMAEGMREHYRRAALRAEELRAGRDIPVIAMGHLFTSGGALSEGVRELRIGSLGQVDAGIFPESLDYVALGHLHLAQKAGGSERIRYSGSPLPLSFAEAARPKEVALLRTAGRQVRVERVGVPSFQRLESVEGALADIEARLEELSACGQAVWAEVTYTGAAPAPDLRERVDARARNGLEILRVRSARPMPEGMDADAGRENLEEMGVEEVFERRLREAFPDADPESPELEGLRALYREVLAMPEREETCAS